MAPTLFAFAGLPGVGKTTLAKAVAAHFRATYLRIDTIEQALRGSNTLHGEVGIEGYLIAYKLAEENLRLGQSVVADSVNPLQITRDAWRLAASNASASVIEIEVVCSDLAEHRWRIENRISGIDGLKLPSWDAVQNREYDAWREPHIVIDTAGKSPHASIDQLLARLSEK